MMHEQVPKYSKNRPLQKKPSHFATSPKTGLITTEVESQEKQPMPNYTPLSADWDASQHPLLKNRANATNVVQTKTSNGEKQSLSRKSVSSEERPNHTGMPNQLKAGLEHLSGRNLSNVRVHRNSCKPSQVQALAYTQGTNIYLGPGQEKHLPHEGWHVVQQMAGRVKPTMQMKGVNINDDVGLEKEADVLGSKALGFGNNNPQSNLIAPELTHIVLPSGANRLVQRFNGDDEKDKQDYADRLRQADQKYRKELEELKNKQNYAVRLRKADWEYRKKLEKLKEDTTAKAADRNPEAKDQVRRGTEGDQVGASFVAHEMAQYPPQQEQFLNESKLGKLREDELSDKEIKQLKDEYKRRYLKPGSKRLMTPNEIQAFKQLNDKQEKLNNELKTGTYSDAIEYINRQNYQDWLTIDPAKRLLITSLIHCKDSGILLSEEQRKKTPPYAMSLSLAGKKEEIREYTVANWQKTLDAGYELSDEAKASIGEPTTVQAYESKQKNGIKILKKVFLLLQVGLKERIEDGDYNKWTENVSTALSHGGRVNIRIPKLQSKQENAYALLHWLGITDEQGHKDKQTGVYTRAFGTHHMNIDETGKFKEEGGKKAALKNKVGSTKLYGLDLTIGGFGQQDFNGEYILPDGKNGHMFIGFRPPTLKTDGALEIGIETTAPGAASNVGYKHTWRSTEATANPLSSAGGAKADKHGKGKLDWNRIELSDIAHPFEDEINTWLDQLKGLELIMMEKEMEDDKFLSGLVGKRK